MRILSIAAFTFLLLLTMLLCRLSPAALAAKKSDPPPVGMAAAVQGAAISFPDAKYPGKPLCELHFAAASGQSVENGFLGAMTQVYAQLYQQGKPAATLSAPKANGSSLRKTVVITSTGGVVVKSLLQPGTRLQADTVVWYASINKIVATGHVFFREGKSGAITTGPKMVADTKLKSITIVSGHATASL